MNFLENRGNQGACFSLNSFTELIDSDSTYLKNYAYQGGVIFAIGDSKFSFTRANFLQNIAVDSGSVLYAMYNSQERALSFNECEFTQNSAKQDLIQLMSSKAYIIDSTFTDNSAIIVNHGITMITSKLEFVSSNVTFSEEFAALLTKEKLSKLDTGFFSLFLSS